MIQVSLVAFLASSLVMASPANAPATKVPPPSNFIKQSWAQMANLPSYKYDCTLTAGAVTEAPGLTGDTKNYADLLVSALPLLSQKESMTLMSKGMKASATRVKSPSVRPYTAMLSGQLTYDQAVTYTAQTPQFSLQFVVNSQGVYYRGTSKDTWKLIKNKDVAKAMFDSEKDSTITTSVSQDSMNFSAWADGKASQAVYKGKLTKDSVKNIVTDAVGATFANEDSLNEISVYIDKSTKRWTKLETTITVDTGSVAFPLLKTCKFYYGKDATVSIPAKPKTVDAKTGAAEFMDLISSVE
ncbi:MAG: hypothetical protein PHC70_05445 [Patescibacteria group bacterium]|nr:hypothetical protein [Patescibacteria group bacterium]